MTGGTQRTSRRQLAWAIPALVVAVPAAVLPHLNVLAGGIVPILQALLPVAAVAMLVLAVVPLIARAWLAAGILVLGALLAGVPALTSVKAPAECAGATPLTVLSFNAKVAQGDPGELAGLIRSSEADAVALLETDEEQIDALLNGEGLSSALPYRTREVSAGGFNGSVILSAHPLSDEEEIAGSVFDQVSAVATLADGTEVRLAAVHPPPPVGQPVDWHDAVSDIDDWIRGTSDEHLVVAGDLNASFAHPAFRQLASSLRTAAEAAGPIPWPTWPEEKPVPAFTAIDHVLARGAEPTGWQSVAISGSDHRAVVGSWALCGSEATGL
jgi:endonuclease/exonuclease/phosphatase (EEP) superfamily protein YafD